MYGAGANKISQQVTKDSGKFFSPQEAQEIVDEYFGEFSKLKDWIEETKGFIKANGFIYSHFGRKRRLPDVFSSDRAIQSHAIRSGLNFVVQSPASDVNLLGAIDTHAAVKAAKLDARIFALVHDSVLAEVRDDVIQEYSDILVSCIQKDRGLSIPGFPIGVEIEVGKDYSMGKYDKLYGHNV
jgi:DNA polymerase I-like protein with 3'-5' exonuclease and polymerase domains